MPDSTVVATPQATIPGWYGKLPGLGDFASRRLPAEFITPWDAWLQEVMQASRAALGEAWLDSYLTMPIWRFLLLPGLVTPTGWTGLLMSSVDRVGRHFPLTLAVEVASPAAAAHVVFDASEWFVGLEEAALGMLDTTRGPEDLDRSLGDLAITAPPDLGTDLGLGAMRDIPSLEAFDVLVRAEALDAWARQAGWKGLWWTRGHLQGAALAFASATLPTAEEFRALLDGRPLTTREVSGPAPA
jgi:type VI secretion system protein ImpM